MDANNFFVSCERVFRPDLNKKPVMVLSGQDGCIVSRSKEVKDLGIPMGAPFFKVKDMVKTHNIHVFSSNFHLYRDVSKRMMATVQSLNSGIEIYSIDEAFLDMSSLDDPKTKAMDICQTVFKRLSIPTCIGISKTKVLAKVATYMAKTHPSFGGICFLKEENEIDEVLKSLSVGDLWGIGRHIKDALQGCGISSAYGLKHADLRAIKQRFGVMVERIVRELNGIPCLEFSEEQIDPKSLQVTRSFKSSITDLKDLIPLVASHAAKAGERLRSKNLKTKCLGVMIRTSRFSKQEFFAPYAEIVLRYPTDDTAILIKVCTQLLERIYQEKHLYHQAGVILKDLSSRSVFQQDLFDPPSPDLQKRDSLMKTMDHLNQRFGSRSLFFGTCGPSPLWQDKSEFLSPSYMCKWSDLPTVYCR